jgi:nucleotide-binding universal stress UspA family protein
MDAKEFLGKILVAIDGSTSSLMAEETAATIAKKARATVTILHVSQTLTVGYRLPSRIEDEILSNIEQESEIILNDARALFREEKVKADTKIVRGGDPANSILKVAKNYDMVVIGAHGENEKEPYALGSVTKKVMTHTSHPTLIVKNVSPMANLLVCIDGSENSIRALDYALRFAEKIGSEVALLNVQEQRLHKASPKTAEELSGKILSKALGAAGRTKIKVDKKLEFGVVPDRIVEVAEKGNYDLIVLGSRGLGVVSRFLLGSVSDDVSHKAKCSVLIVPHKK